MNVMGLTYVALVGDSKDRDNLQDLDIDGNINAVKYHFKTLKSRFSATVLSVYELTL